MPLMPAAQVIAQAVAMAQLYDNIAAGAIASWDVQNISQAYNHLRIVVLARTDRATVADSILMRLNNDSGSNYDSQREFGSAATPAASEHLGTSFLALTDITGDSATADRAGQGVYDVLSYTQTTFDKIITGCGGYAEGTATGQVKVFNSYGVWRNTAAINRVTVFPGTGPNLIAGSRLTIYGLL